jgi:hypothetical protein
MQYVRDVLTVLCHIVAYEGGDKPADGCHYAWALFAATTPTNRQAARCVTIFMDGESIAEDVTYHVDSGELQSSGPPQTYGTITELMWHSSPFLQLALQKVQVYLPDRGDDYMHDIGCYLKRMLPVGTDVWLNEMPMT